MSYYRGPSTDPASSIHLGLARPASVLEQSPGSNVALPLSAALPGEPDERAEAPVRNTQALFADVPRSGHGRAGKTALNQAPARHAKANPVLILDTLRRGFSRMI